MTTLTLNKRRGSIVSVLLYVLGTLAGIAYNYFFVYINKFSVDLVLIIVFFGMFAAHELTHYLYYRFISGVESSSLIFAKDKKMELPYFKINKYVDKRALALSLILPFFITSTLVIVLNTVTGNFTYCFLLGISFAMSGADFVMAHLLINESEEHWMALDNEFGFVGME